MAQSGAPRRRRRPNGIHTLWPEPLESLLEYTALYHCYHLWVSKQLWSVAAAARYGTIKGGTLACVPGPCAELLLRHLQVYYGVEISDDNEQKASNITYTVDLIESAHVQDICAFEKHGDAKGKDNVRIHKPLGDLHVIAGVQIDWVQPRAIDGLSRLVVTTQSYKVTASEADVRTGIPAPSPSRQMAVVESAKATLRAWVEECGSAAREVIAPRLVEWSHTPTVEPVTAPVAAPREPEPEPEAGPSSSGEA